MGRMSSRKYRRIISHAGKKEKLWPPKFREEYGGRAQCLELLVWPEGWSGRLVGLSQS